jgi:UTP--glucose-1-phosphate uridylyltransferase
MRWRSEFGRPPHQRREGDVVTFRKAIIPVAGTLHRALPLQHITTGDGRTRHAIALQIEDLLGAGVEHVGLVTGPGQALFFQELVSQYGQSIVLLEQREQRGFGHAVLCAESWIAGEPFLVQVCDHMFITYAEASCPRQLIDVARREGCSVSGVQVTSESQLQYFGVIGGRRLPGDQRLCQIETVIEKPTPTVAEEKSVVPGLRQGTYLAFFGVHALLPSIFDHLRSCQARLAQGESLGLTEALASLLSRERYLALEVRGHRIDLEGPFGFLRAQLALALQGRRREEVLRLVLEEVAQSQADPSSPH